MDAASSSSLLAHLSAIPDPRSRHGRQHSLSAVLAMVCCAMMCGARSYSAIAQWAANQDIRLIHRLGFTRTPPKLGGVRKVLMAIDPDAFETALSRWAEGLLGPLPTSGERSLQAYAIDGKTSCGSFDGLKKPIHLLSMVAHATGITVTQATVPQGVSDKTNEHKTAMKLLERVALEGRVITGDAIFCQRDLSQQIVSAGGHYFWYVKENQPTLLADIQVAFAPSEEGAFSPAARSNFTERP